MLICIDAGHCLSTPGKRCLKSIDPGETREWGLNSRVADKLEAILAGYDCRTMRVDDVTGRRDVTLSQRVAAANRAKADVYLSIHHNAGINGGSGGGIVAYVAPSHQKQSEVVRDAVYRYTVAATGLRGNRAQPLAEQSLYVLNYTTMPATLIELGFMDSTTDTPIILTEQFADQAAAGLAAALVEVYDLQAKGGGQVLMTAVPAEDLTVELVDRPKSECGDNCANAGYFANYSEAGEPFTLPAGHLAHAGGPQGGRHGGVRHGVAVQDNKSAGQRRGRPGVPGAGLYRRAQAGRRRELLPEPGRGGLQDRGKPADQQRAALDGERGGTGVDGGQSAADRSGGVGSSGVQAGQRPGGRLGAGVHPAGRGGRDPYRRGRWPGRRDHRQAQGPHHQTGAGHHGRGYPQGGEKVKEEERVGAPPLSNVCA